MKPRATILRRRWDRLSREEARKLQLARLRRYLRDEVLPFSRHYRWLFSDAAIEPRDLRKWEDLALIPFTRKRDLFAEDGTPRTEEFVLIPDEKVLRRRLSTVSDALMRGPAFAKAALEKEYRPILMTSTTGRAAQPVPFLFTHHDLDNLAITGRRLMRVCDSRPEWRHLNLFPYAPHLAFWQAHYAGLGYNTFTLSTGGGKVMGTSGNARMMVKIAPDAIIGMPTFVYHILQEAVSHAAVCPNIKRIVLGGEKVPDGMRRKLRAMCAELGSQSVEVMATYGFTEAKMAWPECPCPAGAASGGFHLSPDLGIVEVVDPETGAQTGDGQPGEIVFTPLDSRGSVVIRYRTGDLISGGLVHTPCPHCGRNLPRLVGKISRVSDIRRLNIEKLKGTLVNFNDFEHVLDDMDTVGAWQIEIRKRNDDPMDCDELIVHVAPSRRTGSDALATAIKRRLREATGIGPNRIEFHDAEALRGLQGVGRELKEVKVVDHRPGPMNSPKHVEE